MKRFLFALAFLAMPVACAGLDQVATVAASPTGQALVAGVTNFTPGVSSAVAKVNAGLAVTDADKKLVCGGISWASAAFAAFAPAAGASAEDVAAERAGMVAANAICSGTTTDVASAVTTVANAYVKTTATLQAAGVPVQAPLAAAALPPTGT